MHIFSNSNRPRGSSNHANLLHHKYLMTPSVPKVRYPPSYTNELTGPILPLISSLAITAAGDKRAMLSLLKDEKIKDKNTKSSRSISSAVTKQGWVPSVIEQKTRNTTNINSDKKSKQEENEYCKDLGVQQKYDSKTAQNVYYIKLIEEYSESTLC